jgi:hypothetical protein
MILSPISIMTGKIQPHFLDLPLKVYPVQQALKLFDNRSKPKIIQDNLSNFAEFFRFSPAFYFDLL